MRFLEPIFYKKGITLLTVLCITDFAANLIRHSQFPPELLGSEPVYRELYSLPLCRKTLLKTLSAPD